MMNRFFFSTPFSPDWLPLLRCGTGILLLLTGVQLWADFDILYGSQRIIDHRLLRIDGRYPEGGLIFQRGHLAVYIACAALLAWGRWARLWAVLLCLLHHQLYFGQPAFSYGFDFIAASALFYCVWFPVSNPGSRWATPCLRVLQLHLCALYFFGGLDKVLGSTWHNGEALWKALQLPDLAGAWRPDIAWLGQYPLLVAALGWLVVLLELAYPVCIWLRHTRQLWVWGTVGMHVGIALFMGLYHFSAMMVILNLCAFYLPYRKSARSEQIVHPYHHPAPSARQRPDPSEAAHGAIPNTNAPSV